MRRILNAFLLGYILFAILYAIYNLEQIVDDLEDRVKFLNESIGHNRYKFVTHTHLEDGSVYVPDPDLISALRKSLPIEPPLEELNED